jgi:hypothetical protein
VTVVLATDIFDKELNDLRTKRWEAAFGNKEAEAENKDSDLRATIVIEHIIQASDVSHTMQHWHVYQKWNRSLFKELRKAFKAGRLGKDPAEFWYKGELGFFDNYGKGSLFRWFTSCIRFVYLSLQNISCLVLFFSHI